MLAPLPWQTPFVLPPPAVCTDNDVDVPKAWEESDPRYIADSQEVRLRSFTTKVFAALCRARACVRVIVFATRGAQPLFLGIFLCPDHMQVHKVDAMVSYAA